MILGTMLVPTPAQLKQCLLLVILIVCSVLQAAYAAPSDDARVEVDPVPPSLPESGRCSMLGNCGTREDGDPLPCARESPAAVLTHPEALQALRTNCPLVYQQGIAYGGRYWYETREVKLYLYPRRTSR